MGRATGISWTDHTFNPWWGCTKVSPGCDNCYADTFDKRTFPVNIGTEEKPQIVGKHWGKGVPRRTFSDKHWKEPIRWNHDATFKFGRPARVFCASMADVMDDEAPEGARERLWELIDKTPNLIWQLLTKRPHRYDRYLPTGFRHNNVWLGTTAENQEFYNIRYPYLRAAAMSRGIGITWISYEPALGSLRVKPMSTVGTSAYPKWIIAGGESGHDPKEKDGVMQGRRPFEKQWAEDLRDECKALGIAFFVKQMGARTAAEGKTLIPPDLMIQQYPA